MTPVGYYRQWLSEIVAAEQQSHSYDDLLEIAWSMPFDWVVPNDHNRAADGIDLRYRFEQETSVMLPNLGDCTIFEMLVALAIRWNEAMYDNRYPNMVPYYFWKLIENLDLLDCYTKSVTDNKSVTKSVTVFTNLVGRTYDFDGRNGGLFPSQVSQKCHTDMRELEIWDQMMIYLSENM